MASKWIPALLVACLASASWAGAQDDKAKKPESAAKHTIDELSFISGDWEMKTDTGRTQENWTHPDGGSMLGTGRVIRDEKMVFFEFLRIETRNDNLFYVAQPGGGSGTVFRLTSLEKKTAVFENPKHDFPKKITYRLEEDGSLLARIEGDGTETEKPKEFRFKSRARK
jgi:hypothetical protein